MKNRILSDYLVDLRVHLSHLPYREQDAILKEVEAHLAARMEDLAAANPRMSEDERVLAATAAFGAPSEIGFRDGPAGGLVRKSTGELLLRAAVLTGRAAAATGKAAGRGARHALKWLGIVGAVLLGAGLVVFIVAAFVGTHLADTYHKEIAESMPHEAYSYTGAWGQTEPHTDVAMKSFGVPATAKELRLRFTVSPVMGCAAIQVTTPSGTTVSINGNGCSRFDEEATYTETGTYQVRYTFVGYAGSLQARGVYFEKAA